MKAVLLNFGSRAVFDLQTPYAVSYDFRNVHNVPRLKVKFRRNG